MELAEGTGAATELYNYVLGRVGIKPAYALNSALPTGVLIYATVLRDAVMYVMVSDSAEDVRVDVRDEKTQVPLQLTLRSQHAAIAVIGLQEKSVVAKYGF